ncbi:MAG: VOC family protein [Candidatus Sumerlaeia bacterium]|nr:VOC family protein [Candidatus Sumerlaeia bacterium]
MANPKPNLAREEATLKKPERLGLMGVDSFRYIVHDPERSKRFYLDNLGFREVARSTPEIERLEGAKTVVYGAQNIRVEVASPNGERTWAKKFLDLHPDGVSHITFRVRDLEHAVRFMKARGANFVDDPMVVDRDGGTYKKVSIISPLSDVIYSFIERPSNYDNFAPGFERVGDLYPRNEFGFRFVDHITSNTLTMAPAVWFYKHIMGMETYWNIQFHTSDVNPDWHKGSGLRSEVVWDPDSGIKFATNEPLMPKFRNSQINIFCNENFGSGVQHVAFAVPDILEAVDELHRRKILFLDAPEAYYDNLPERMRLRKIFNMDKPIDRLRDLGILLDGEDDHYLLQIFMKDSQTMYEEAKAGPFFYELIQRAGANGFGEGNFRALFESIEAGQEARMSGAAGDPPMSD